MAPADATAHIALFVTDGADGRVVPPLDIQITVRDQNNHDVARERLP